MSKKNTKSGLELSITIPPTPAGARPPPLPSKDEDTSSKMDPQSNAAQNDTTTGDVSQLVILLFYQLTTFQPLNAGVDASSRGESNRPDQNSSRDETIHHHLSDTQKVVCKILEDAIKLLGSFKDSINIISTISRMGPQLEATKQVPPFNASKDSTNS
jgi:hypothetical protein